MYPAGVRARPPGPRAGDVGSVGADARVRGPADASGNVILLDIRSLTRALPAPHATHHRRATRRARLERLRHPR
jgi:hypothetical protein